MNNNYSWKSYKKHVSLFNKILEIDTNQDKTRNAIISRAVNVSKNTKCWEQIQSKISVINTENCNPVKSMAISLNDEDSMVMNELKIIISKNLSLDEIKIPFLIKLLLISYLELLKKEKLNIVNRGKIEDLAAPEMVSVLTELVLLNRVCDLSTIENIKYQLLNWKNNIKY